MNTEKEYRETLESSLTQCAASGARALPAWFVGRMMMDNWAFGLVTSAGVLAISTIVAVVEDKQGSLWLDVKMLPEGEFTRETHYHGREIIFAPFRDRRDATIRADSVIAAFELYNS